MVNLLSHTPFSVMDDSRSSNIYIEWAVTIGFLG